MKTAIITTLTATAAAMCNYGTSSNPRSVDTVTVAKFGYNDIQGPLNWYALNTNNTACGLGRHQSPVNLQDSNLITTTKGSATGFSIQSYPHGTLIENLGSTLEVPANGTATLHGKTYSLEQFHFHTPGEHRVDSEHFPMEWHFVLENKKDSSIYVVAFLLEIGELLDPLSLVLSSVFENVEKIATPGSTSTTGPLDFSSIEEHLHSNNAYQYTGSLTTPPCSESVTWTISQEPLYIPASLYRRVKKVLKFNARYSQDVLGNINLLDKDRDNLDGKKAS